MSQSPSRRKALLAWAAQSSTLILEDDYNGEYRYRGRPLTTLHSMAAPGQVIYMGSFSKLLFPALRLGYMVVPETIIEPIANARWLLDRHSPPLEQAVLTDFINDGHLLRHLRRMRSLYALRQDSLLSTLEQHLGELLEATPLDGGLHLIAKLHAEVNPEQFFSTARAANITLSSVAQFSHRATKLAQRQVIFGYAPYSEEQMQLAAQALMRRYRKP
jgi:GntR family transcriptional regulator/MocR family aminotransferase